MKTLAVIILLSLGAKANAQSFQSGLWKSKSSFKLNGIPMPSSEDENCISKAEAKNAKASIENALKKQGCTLNHWIVKDKQLTADLACKNKDVEATGKLSGEISKKSYDLKGEAKGKYKQAIPSVASMELTGEWAGEKCTKKE
jgi:hypothetical protein